VEKIPNCKCFGCGAPLYRKPYFSARHVPTCKKCWPKIAKKSAKQGRADLHDLYIESWKAGKETGMKGSSSISSHIRRYLFDKYGNSCCLCGWNKVNPYTGRVPLEVNHIDGDFRNNKEKNLELICPNCHSLTGTYKSRNNGRGRPVTRGYIKIGRASQLAMAPGLNPGEA
jgi:hypothetical protein